MAGQRCDTPSRSGDATTKSLTVAMSGAPATTNPDFMSAWSDDTGTAFTEGSTDGVLNGTTAVTLVAAPAASTRRLIKTVYVQNKDTAAVTITITYNNNSTLRTIAKVTLQVGDTWSTDGTTDSTGALKQTLGTANLASVTGTLAVANGGTGATTLAGANIAVINVANTFTATQTFNGSSSTSAVKTLNIAEPGNTVGSAPSATTNFYVNSGAVQYYTTNAANNWTLNIAFSSGTSLNTAMATNDSISITMLATQGSTAYYNSAVTIDGTSVTPKWQGGTAPTSGNASGIDSYTYVIYKTASATYTVLAAQTKFA